MALAIKDRVKELTTTTGTGTLTLSSAPSGYRRFNSVLSDGDTTYYTIESGTQWEVGVGTYTANTLARTTVLASSNSGSRIDITAARSFVFITYPADKALYKDGSNRAVIGAAGLIFSDNTVQTTAATTPDLSPYALLPDTLPAVGTLLSYGGDRQLAAGGTVTHSGALHLTGAVRVSNDAADTLDVRSDVRMLNFLGLGLTTSGVGIGGFSYRPGVNLGAAAGIHFTNDTPAATNEGTIVRSGTGVLDLRANNGLRIRNLANSADAALTCGQLTVTQTLLTGNNAIKVASPVRFAFDDTSWNGGSVDAAIGRESAGVVGLYTTTGGSTKAALTCGAITATVGETATPLTLSNGWNSVQFKWIQFQRPSISATDWLSITNSSNVGYTFKSDGFDPTADSGQNNRDNVADLGDASSRWRDFHLGRDAYVGGNIVFAPSYSSSGEIQRNGSTGTQGVVLRETSSGAAISVVPNQAYVYANSGLRVYNTIGTGDGPITCGAITASGIASIAGSSVEVSGETAQLTINSVSNGNLLTLSSPGYKDLRWYDTSNNKFWQWSHRVAGESNKFQLYHNNAGSYSLALSFDTSINATFSGDVGIAATKSLNVGGDTTAFYAASNAGVARIGFIVGGAYVGSIRTASNQLVLAAPSGVRVRNNDDSADAPISCSLLTANGGFRANDRSLFDGVLAIGGSLTASLIHPNNMRVTWTDTSSYTGTIDTAVGRDSAGVVGLYTSHSGSTKAALICGAITTSGLLNLQNSTTPQRLTLHATYTSSTSFANLDIRANSGGTAYEISSFKGSGGGANLPINIGHRDASDTFTKSIGINTNGELEVTNITNTSGRINIGNSSAWGLTIQSNGADIRIQQSARFGICSGSSNADPDISIGRASANTLGLYASQVSSTLANLTCGEVTTSGAIKPATLTDAAAPNGSIYYSSTAGKLVYKDASGVVNNLY